MLKKLFSLIGSIDKISKQLDRLEKDVQTIQSQIKHLPKEIAVRNLFDIH